MARLEAVGALNVLIVYVLLLGATYSEKMTVSKYFWCALIMEFIQQKVEIDGLMADQFGEEEEVRRTSDIEFMDDKGDFQNQNAQAYRLANVVRNSEDALQDKSINKEFAVCSDPENYTSDSFDAAEYGYDDFKGFERKIKKFSDELKIVEVGSRDSVYNATLLGIYSKSRENFGITFEEKNIVVVIGCNIHDKLKENKARSCLGLKSS